MATVSANDCTNGKINGRDRSRRTGPSPQRLHRIATVRQQQGVSHRCAARRLGKDIGEIKAQEEEKSDLKLSDLYAWQSVLDVPLEELLVDPGSPLSSPVMERARLVRLMKTAAAIHEDAKNPAIQRLAERMVDQLIEIMPELAEVGAWHSVGQRRSMDDYGRVVERRLSEDLIHNFSRGYGE